MRFCPASSDIGASAPNRRHNAQLLSNLLQRGVLLKPLQSINHGLLVSHKAKLHLCRAGRKTRRKRPLVRLVQWQLRRVNAVPLRGRKHIIERALDVGILDA